MSSTSIARLRQFADRTNTHLACDLCRSEVNEKHRHLLELSSRQIWCDCDACCLLFSESGENRFRLIPQRVTKLEIDFDDAAWTKLGIPIGLAYFQIRAPDQWLVGYPSPAGAVMASVEEEARNVLLMANTLVESLQREVEALVINRTSTEHQAFIVPLDRCYQLIGIIRQNWEGWTGGPRINKQVDLYFDQLEEAALQGARL